MVLTVTGLADPQQPMGETPASIQEDQENGVENTEVGTTGGEAVEPASPAEELDPQMPKFGPRQVLLTKDFPNGEWSFFSSKKDSPPGETWKIQSGEKPDELILVCTGEPYGYMQTRKTFGDFELGFQWRYPEDENGNSGLLLFTSGEDRLWPDSLQIQLHHSTAGSTFPSGSAKSDNELRNVPPLTRPPGQWNECVVSSAGGIVIVSINGKRVGVVTGCSPVEGRIALQSEGSEIHFREIWIREISGTDTAETSGIMTIPRSKTSDVLGRSPSCRVGPWGHLTQSRRGRCSRRTSGPLASPLQFAYALPGCAGLPNIQVQK
ncbi:MAG: DUF1080 domain-containing protein [Planctomycetaceae bacterium]|nr:DUF1080 domain-containing protein [Planctomycetaceae bacterium]MCA9091518.1 DUF1080 domain-containing protein [Planctomycetaceae bacterium]